MSNVKEFTKVAIREKNVQLLEEVKKIRTHTERVRVLIMERCALCSQVEELRNLNIMSEEQLLEAIRYMLQSFQLEQLIIEVGGMYDSLINTDKELKEEVLKEHSSLRAFAGKLVDQAVDEFVNKMQKVSINVPNSLEKIFDEIINTTHACVGESCNACGRFGGQKS